ncbi:Fic family protein [Fimbriimonas ginsengisoli]|uniref:Death-on-curing (DOC) family protein n=1 Tax=Fimbriimonas ginsengisoli Gsoil 348 TaxID=661478 RepID=A0A068NQV0_FIMGI|nr:Fic family protein [Fimbriimonas ginsengisoli]AIE85757.1 death-on-curing (DOC) family protein [Fimbriimonas ginsengisoli Gsoil 348]
MAATLHYLTVQDVLWINLQATKKVHHFNFARLEEATFYQYAYGESKTLLPQAARFVTGFLRMHPFEAGNEATAFIAVLSFLKLNGTEIGLTDDDAVGWFDRIADKAVSARDAISRVTSPSPHGHGHPPEVREAIQAVLDDFPATIASLAERSAVAV